MRICELHALDMPKTSALKSHPLLDSGCFQAYKVPSMLFSRPSPLLSCAAFQTCERGSVLSPSYAAWKHLSRCTFHLL